ncbi:MAG: serine hydrolase family protein [Candidatus Aenigmatarchaeota archaeon]|nr:MAG: serine hydrolase family protein [Candidatus Aenigmarchaeota archaeon]
MKRVFLVHGWESSPKSDWFPWLKDTLEKKGCEVVAPAMPNTDAPEIGPWVQALTKAVGTPDKDTYFVGHSIGCQTILRYLESLPEGSKVGGALFVAGWFTLVGLETEEEKTIAKPWIESDIDFKRVKKTTKKFVAIFSDNDPYVPIGQAADFEMTIGARVLIRKRKGHFRREDGVTEYKLIYDELKKLMK